MSARILTAVALTAVLAVAGCGSKTQDASQKPGQGTTTAASEESGPGKSCEYGGDSPAPEGKDVGKPPKRAEDKPGTVTLTTNQGEVTVALATDKAPCTTRSFAYLAGKKYFDGTPCHRLTAASSLKVLQCGDPTGQGTGGPGYTVPDENPTDLAESERPGVSQYPRGTVAMANTGQPNSGGSQFFLVYADSQLPPKYAVFGKVDEKGLATLDKIAAAGVAGGGQDGEPATKVTIDKATATG